MMYWCRHAPFLTLLLFCLAAPALPPTLHAETQADQAVTTGDPAISADELALLLKPLSKGELLVEAEGWREIVKAKAEEIARAEIAIKRENREIATAQAVEEKAKEVRKTLRDVAEQIAAAKASNDPEAARQAAEAAAAVRAQVRELGLSLEEAIEAVDATAEVKQQLAGHLSEDVQAMSAAAAKARETVSDLERHMGSDTGDAPQAGDGQDLKVSPGDAADLQQAVAAFADAEDVTRAKKVELLDRLTRLREQRTRLLDNMRAVIDELEAKTDQKDSDTLARIRDYRLYLRGLSGINVDVTDATSAWVSIRAWLVSAEGGVRWLINLLSFGGVLVAAWFVAKLASRGVLKATSRLRLPGLLADFLVKSARWVVMIIGAIWALSTLEVSVAPLLAMVGAASFILAFAMQDSLSNFASGLMILFFRPFDTGDVVDAGGVSGKVSSMNLVSTTIKTFDNKLMVVPNSKIWSDVITNATGVVERRVDLEFGISYSDDIDQAQAILEQIVVEHPKVLKEPAPTIKLSALADSSVNFICRPWTRTADYWDVYWDITRAVKKRFDAAGIGIPFPQRDVHLYIEEGDAGKALSGSAPKVAASNRPVSDQRHEDGGLDG